jgi:hypothetical protein
MLFCGLKCAAPASVRQTAKRLPVLSFTTVSFMSQLLDLLGFFYKIEIPVSDSATGHFAQNQGKGVFQFEVFNKL